MRLTVPRVPRIPKISDSITLGLMGGFIATVVMDFSNLLSWKNRKAETTFGHLSGSILMSGIRTKRKKNFILGQIIHMITGSLISIPLVYLLKITGKDHSLIKGASFGSFVWMLLYVFGEHMGMYSSKARLTKTHYSTLLNNILYGVVSAKTITYLANPKIFMPKTDAAMNLQIEPSQNMTAESHGLPLYNNYGIDQYVH